METYSCFLVEDGIPSSSSPDLTYAVKVQLDNRIGDLEERIRSAVLTCNCPGWARRGEPRRCRHTFERIDRLSEFRARNTLRVREEVPTIGCIRIPWFTREEAKAARNDGIWTRAAGGESYSKLVEAFGVKSQRIG